jgi:uncharacterized repeat protein (TIGR01451 family)
MTKTTTWTISGVQLNRFIPLVIATATICFAGSPDAAHAAGTAAGTKISNTATATYTDAGGTAQNTSSNKVDVTVAELLDVAVVHADSADVQVAPGATNRVLAFRVTNSGNGDENMRFVASGTIGGDQFDPTVTSIVIDNGNNIYEPGVDTVYVAGTNEPLFTADQTRTIFVLSTIPAGAGDGDKGFASLNASAKTGTGTAGTIFAGQGTGGADAVVGTTTAAAVDKWTYIVKTSALSYTKTATIADPFGGTEPVPGAIITYTLTAAVNGSSSLTNLTLSDPIPVNTTYQAGTLFQGTTNLSDTPANDAGEVVSGTVTVRLGTVAGGATQSVTFKVKIN